MGTQGNGQGLLVYDDTFVQLPVFVKTALPTPADAGALIYVSNDVGGAVVAFGDGTNWRRVTDRAIIA